MLRATDASVPQWADTPTIPRTRPQHDVFLGIDVGSTTVKLVAVDPAGRVLFHRYVRANGQPRETLLRASGLFEETLPGASTLGVGLTGSGGEPVAHIVGGVHANELVTQCRAVGARHREARTVIEIGGQDSKFLSVRWDEARGQMTLLDFAMNTLCAAGTGSFLDQQAGRLGIEIDGEFARLALASRSPARIAGRCTVFAKSDMIHWQQQGVPLEDILAGLCLALARNFRSVIGKGKSFTPPVLFQGGVARNAAVVRAFEEVLDLEPGGLVVPEHPDLMPAIGAALLAMDEAREGREHPFRGFGALEASLRDGADGERSLAPLAPRPTTVAVGSREPRPAGATATSVCLGIDVGSISTNVVLLDEDDQVVARRYLPTAGDPIEAVRRGLSEVGEETDTRVRVVGVGVTGSGRHLTGHYVGADVVRNEITAQARAAVAAVPGADTVIEIGGQDSKYIRLCGGVVVDFAMNNACAAGTGSFLEEQADRLGISVERDFARRALAAPAPACLGERCTVFMESDLVHHQQRGASLENLTAGLAYSIARNYLNRVVAGRPIGERVLFQGGVAHNAAVVSAFEGLLGRRLTVPPHHDVTGAIGAAILAREARAARPGEPTRFRGFDVADRPHATRSFVCRACPNLCEVQKVTVSADRPLFFGARCERFERKEPGGARQGRRETIPDLFAERRALLYGDYEAPGPRSPRRRRIGIPRVLTFHDLFPFWRAFFRHLDMDVVLSDETNPHIVRRTAHAATSETCFPVKLVSGHVLDLLEKDVDDVFLPAVLDREDPAPGQPHSHYCPLIPAAGYMVGARLEIERRGARILAFPLSLAERRTRPHELRVVARRLGVSLRKVLAAAARGDEAQRAFSEALRTRGEQVLRELTEDGPPAVVVVGRPYNTCDPGVCQDLPGKLRKLGALPIPVDLLAGGRVDLGSAHPDMYWRSGQEILGTARIAAAEPRLHCIYLTSFHCGPDSFLLTYFRRVMNGKPFLELELDDHTAEAGIVTRCEAFLDSLTSAREARR
ncbi:MAG: acyl-CoA dehydratase activase [Acidobacteria bacterium]|nr:acyl-CoA dehydratase activase [Acidobacteriota bacterium]